MADRLGELGLLSRTESSGPAALRDELALGRGELSGKFRSSPSRIFGAGKRLAAATGSSGAIYQLTAGWACQCRDFSDGHRAIVDIYLPGDVIGLDAVLRGRPLEKVLTLTSIATKTIDAKDALADLMMSRPTALYITWLLGQRQRRADRLLATISSLDARGRVTSILLDFYTRLGRQRLITGSTYNLPMTQTQIGAYLGLTVAHVNRVLRSLRDERIVNFEKHCVTILDLDRLARLAQNAQAVSSIAGLDERPLDEPVPSSGQLIQITGDYSSRLGLQRRTDHGVS